MKYSLVIIYLIGLKAFAENSTTTSTQDPSYSLGWHFGGGKAFFSEKSSMPYTGFTFEIGRKPQHGLGIGLEFNAGVLSETSDKNYDYNTPRHIYRTSSVGLNASRNFHFLQAEARLTVGSFEHYIERESYYEYDEYSGQSYEQQDSRLIQEAGTTSLGLGLGVMVVNTRAMDVTLMSKFTGTLLSDSVTINGAEIDHLVTSELQAKMNFRMYPNMYFHSSHHHCYHRYNPYSTSRLLARITLETLRIFLR
jgi:hypothetical protein